MQRQKAPHWRASIAVQTRARELRKAMTPAEKMLWQHIRNNQLGWEFRKQHAVGPYIVDFFCAKAKLVVEVDGDSHADEIQTAYDNERTNWLNEQKHYRVIRFWNNEILQNVEHAVSQIAELIHADAQSAKEHQ
jgi:very-short-patch-repair endonuclease